jgi:hypothetical protein
MGEREQGKEQKLTYCLTLKNDVKTTFSKTMYYMKEINK